ncbi:MAG TPA: hypothetical protein VML96_11310, partial [Egibacteraceae bacterium]|nr:hypothetical protein [Egibacteraceae bacterium]
MLAAVLAAAGCGEKIATSPADEPSATAPAPAEPYDEPAVDRPPPDSPYVAELAAGLNEAGYDLFQIAAEESDSDVVISPLSIGIAFGMA